MAQRLTATETPCEHKRQSIVQQDAHVVGRVDGEQSIQQLICRIENPRLAFRMQWIAQTSPIVPQRQLAVGESVRHHLLLRKEIRIRISAHDSAARQ